MQIRVATGEWKERWPHYVMVNDAEFVDGDLSNGISLKEMMDALGSDCFAVTKRNAAAKSGNIDSRRAYMQQAAVELSPEGFRWLNEAFERVYTEHGKLRSSALARLDWPMVRSRSAKAGR